MPSFEDPSLYLADFGVACIAGAQQFMGILDQPAQAVAADFVSTVSVEYELKYISAQATLTRGQAITVGGVAYTVRTVPLALDDGVFTVAMLSKT